MTKYFERIKDLKNLIVKENVAILYDIYLTFFFEQDHKKGRLGIP
jgi:hypothetical protein